jgi:hypothetical protein
MTGLARSECALRLMQQGGTGSAGLGATNPEPPRAEEDMVEATVRRRRSVLIVDDQEEVREIAAIHFESLGYDIVQAAAPRFTSSTPAERRP